MDHVEDHRYLHYAVGRTIDAPPEVVWGVLTDAGSYTKWNSTVVSLDGQIAAGELCLGQDDPGQRPRGQDTALSPA